MFIFTWGRFLFWGFMIQFDEHIFSSGLVKNHQVDARSTSDSANGQFFQLLGMTYLVGKLRLKFKRLFHGPLAEEEHFLGGLPDYLVFTSNLGSKSPRFPLNRMNRMLVILRA